MKTANPSCENCTHYRKTDKGVSMCHRKATYKPDPVTSYKDVLVGAKTCEEARRWCFWLTCGPTAKHFDQK